MKHKKNKAVITILSILAFILLASGVFFGTYYIITNNSSNTYESNVKSVIDKVNEVNDSVSSLFKGQALDTVKTRNELSAKIDALSKQKVELEGLTITDNYKNAHKNLIEGLSKNILIFRQIDAIVKNPNGRDIGKAGEDLQKYKDEAVKSYSLVNIKNSKVGLPDNSLKLVEYTTNYVYELVKLNRDNEISQNQNLDFISQMDLLISKFASLNADLTIQMSKTRNESGNIDNVIALAEKNRDDLGLLQQEFSSLTVPSKAVNCYKLFKNTLEGLNIYLQSFVYSANNEKLLEGDKTAEKIKELYSDANIQFNKVSKSYNDFLKAFSEFRETSIKQ